MKPFRIRLRLKLAAACFAYIGIVLVGIHPQQGWRQVEIQTHYGTPCPRPCLFPQLEEARNGSR